MSATGLTQAITTGDDRAREGGVDTLGGVDGAVAVLIEAASAARDHGAKGTDDQCAFRAAAVAHDVDGDRGNALGRKRARHREHPALLAVGEAVPEDCDRPSRGGGRARRDEEIEVDRLVPLRRRLAGSRRHRRDVLLGRLVVR